MAVKPKLAIMSENQVGLFGDAISAIVQGIVGTYSSVDHEIVVIGMATAGNRIINMEDDSALFAIWNKKLSSLSQEVQSIVKSGRKATIAVKSMYTMRGTQEALQEIVAVNFEQYSAYTETTISKWIKEKGFKNFISSGGASAQLGINLSGEDEAAEWMRQIKGRDFSSLSYRCNNQLDKSDYIDLAYICDKDFTWKFALSSRFHPHFCSNKDKKHTCACFGVVSFLAGVSADAASECPTNEHNHLVGGVKETFWTFRERLHQTTVEGRVVTFTEDHESIIDNSWNVDDMENELFDMFQDDYFFLAVRGLLYRVNVKAKQFHTVGNMEKWNRNSKRSGKPNLTSPFQWSTFFWRAYAKVLSGAAVIAAPPVNKGAWTYGAALQFGGKTACSFGVIEEVTRKFNEAEQVYDCVFSPRDLSELEHNISQIE